MEEQNIKLTKLTKCAGCGAKVGAGVLKVVAGVVKVGLRVPSVNIVLITENNRVMSLYFGTFNIPLQCTTTIVHRNTINSVTIKQLILRI